MSATDSISGMNTAELAGATCVEYVNALLVGSGWLARDVRVGRWEIEVDTRNTYPRLVSRDLRRRVPMVGITADGWLRVQSYAWALISGKANQVRVVSFTTDTVDVVVLDGPGVRIHTVDRAHVSSRRP